jgi:hypothetical protein
MASNAHRLDEVHVSKSSSQFVAFDSSCHLAQFHREVLDYQDGWFFADLGSSYPSRVALTADAICALALVLAIAGCSIILCNCS